MNQKVFFQDTTYGFVVDDDLAGRRLRVNAAANLVIYINSIPCLPADLPYIYLNSELREYCPISLKLQGTKLSMTFSCIVCSINNEGIDTIIVQS